MKHYWWKSVLIIGTEQYRQLNWAEQSRVTWAVYSKRQQTKLHYSFMKLIILIDFSQFKPLATIWQHTHWQAPISDASSSGALWTPRSATSGAPSSSTAGAAGPRPGPARWPMSAAPEISPDLAQSVGSRTFLQNRKCQSHSKLTTPNKLSTAPN